MSIKYIKITPYQLMLNGVEIPVVNRGVAMLSEVYRAYVKDYPKFFKMDTLSKLGFIASELLLAEEPNRCEPCEDRAVVMINRSASLCDDMHYQSTITDDNYFPSPSVFVYTLPNIVTGEIAIRNKYYGETSFYVLPEFHAQDIANIITDVFFDKSTRSVIGGWLECSSDSEFYAIVFIADYNTEKTDIINLLQKQYKTK